MWDMWKVGGKLKIGISYTTTTTTTTRTTSMETTVGMVGMVGRGNLLKIQWRS
jgi:hypothetical protein